MYMSTKLARLALSRWWKNYPNNFNDGALSLLEIVRQTDDIVTDNVWTIAVRHRNVNNVSLLCPCDRNILSAVVEHKISRTNRAYNKYTEARLSITLLDKSNSIQHTVNSITNFAVRSKIARSINGLIE